MLFIKVYLFLVLDSTVVLSKINQNHFEIIKQYVHVSDTKNAYIKDVTIQKSERWSIYNMYNDCQTKKMKEHTIHIFYTVISCKFADWIIHKIYDFVKSSPAFYKQEFQNHDRIYETVFHPLFEKSLNTLIININKYIGRLISILNNFLNENSYYSYYCNTNILKSLVSLNIKFQFLSENIENKNKYIIKISDSAIIRLILEEINALQHFLSINCKDLPASYRNSTVYGYWIMTDNVLINVPNINYFLFNLRHLDLESDPFKCHVSQISLDNIAGITSINHISLDIAYAKVKITDMRHVKIKDILTQLKKSFDIDLVYLYLDSVLITIMKLIYQKIFVIKESVSSKIVNNILKINEKISENSINLPKYFVDGFAYLQDIRNIQPECHKALIRFYNESLGSIKLGKWKKSLLRQNHAEIFKKKTTDSDARIKESKIKRLVLTELQPNSMLDDFTYLENITKRILKNFDDLKCINQIFEILYKEKSRYYIPLIDNITAHFPIEENNKILDAICDFVVNTYSICYQVITLINGSIDDKISITSNDAVFDRARKAISSIKNYFLAFMRQNKNIGFLKMAYNIVIILINLKESSIEYKNVYKLKRILNVIMTELNQYGIKNCNSPKLNFLLFNNINFIDFGNSHVIKKTMSEILDYNPDNFNTGTLFFSNVIPHLEDFPYLDIEYLYKIFIFKSNVFKLYAYNIRIHWKGKCENIYDIYSDLMNFTINPLDLYAFYDIYFTFYVSVVYYEIRYSIKNNQFQKIKNRFTMIREMTKFNKAYFPIKLHKLILDIEMLLELPEMSNKNQSEIMAQILKTGEEIEEQLRKNNFSFEKNTICVTIKKGLKTIHLFSKNALEIINSELKSNVNDFNAYFIKFKQ